MDYNPFQSGNLPVELSQAGLHASPRFSLQRSVQMLLANFGFANDPRQKRKILTLTPLMAAEAHSAADSLFAATELADVVDDSGGTAMLKSILMLNKADAATVVDLAFFRANVTSWGAAGAAAALDDTDFVQLIGFVSFAAGDYFSDVGANRFAMKRGIDMILKPTTGTSIWVAGSCGAGTPTPGSTSDLIFRFGIER